MDVKGEHYRRKVSYFYEPDIANSYFGQGHPMKPFRIVIAHRLIMNYGLYKNMSIYRPFSASSEHMKQFHSEDYIKFLNAVNAGNITDELKDLTERFYLGTKGDDCPIFDGLYSFSQISAGGSLSAATKIITGEADIAINWAGGLHHAKKSQASGFCYVNDIVLCILELLKFHKRVLYIDIDVHHGDGVEEAFFTTDRVMTVSFHRFGDDFFPGTGGFNDIGAGTGKNYSINVPLKAGLTDMDYERVFVPIMSRVMSVYNPSAIVLQCGADSLAGDRLGDFNLTLKGHGKCVSYMRKFNVPLILLGGGGYTVKNVSRCWCYETSLALNKPIPNEMPQSEFSEYFKPITKLHFRPERTTNSNTNESLQQCIEHSHEVLRNVQCVPSAQFMDIPLLLLTPPETPIITISSSDEDLGKADSDLSVQIISDNEFYDSP